MAEKHSSNLKERIAMIMARLETEAQVLLAARRLASGGDYCDFFVENNNGGPFHEKCSIDPFLGLDIRARDFTPQRMAGLANLRASARDDYPDFFVEGSGPAWHERIDDFGIREQLTRTEQRVFALRRSTVLQAFTRVAEAVAAAAR
jgi:hypothetical protein